MKSPTKSNPWSTAEQFNQARPGYYLADNGLMFQKLELDPTDTFNDECDWIELNYGTGTNADGLARFDRVLVAMLVDPAPLVDALRDCLTAMQAFRKKVILGDYEESATFHHFTELIKAHVPKTKE